MWCAHAACQRCNEVLNVLFSLVKLNSGSQSSIRLYSLYHPSQYLLGIHISRYGAVPLSCLVPLSTAEYLILSVNFYGILINFATFIILTIKKGACFCKFDSADHMTFLYLVVLTYIIPYEVYELFQLLYLRLDDALSIWEREKT